MTLVPYGKQYIDENDIKLVSKYFRNRLITTGQYVLNLEKKIIKSGTKFIFHCQRLR